MVRNMIFIMECPDCVEENGFITGVPKRGQTFNCPTCGEMFVVRAEWLDDLNGIIEGVGDSIAMFVELPR